VLPATTTIPNGVPARSFAEEGDKYRKEATIGTKFIAKPTRTTGAPHTHQENGNFAYFCSFPYFSRFQIPFEKTVKVIKSE
jgi:hypothetical protein